MSQLEIISILIPDHSMFELLFSLLICISLGVFAYWRNILNSKGSAAAFVIGLIIAVFANIYWLISLIFFLMVIFAVTKLDYNYKQLHGVAEGIQGERGLRNVLANGSIPALIAVFSPILGLPMAGALFICSITIAASDSFANEIGVLSKDAYLITDLSHKVRPGTDGGVSSLGQGAAVLGAFIPSMIGWVLISEFNNNLITVTTAEQMPMNAYTLFLPVIIGFIGCQIDSVLGATMQRNRLISNDDVNFISISLSILIAMVILFLIPI